MTRNFFSLLIILIFCSYNSFGQLTQEYQNPIATYISANDLLTKEKYSAARDEYEQLVFAIENKTNPIREKAEFEIAHCAYELLNNDAIALLNNFINTYSESIYLSNANFYLGSAHYREKNYRKSIKSFNNVNINSLSEEQQSEYYFKKGYSAFMTNDSILARSCFMPIKDNNTHWAIPATYYYAHISYTDKQYNTAIASFQKLIGDDTFGDIAPYYIAQIYYLQKNYEALLNFVAPMLDKPTIKRQSEMARMAGDAMYATKNYKLAEHYFQIFEEKNKEPLTRQDKYIIAYTQYLNKNYIKAIENFSSVCTQQDTLTQNSYYHLADCYLKTEKKQYALNSFQDAYKLNINQSIAEDALFNFARLSYELDYQPYNGAIKALQNYINNYPKSIRVGEARELLVDLLMSTGNYKDAISVINKIKIKNERILQTYQKVNFFHGIELFNSGNYYNAQKLFENAIIHNYNPEIRAEATFWKAEAEYKQHKYDSAAISYKLFTQYTISEKLAYYAKGYYGLGYSQMQRKNYKQAANSFEEYLKKANNDDKYYKNDAELRLADCYYVIRDFKKAADCYQKALGNNIENNDYALLQKANCEGVQGNYTAKQNSINILLNKYPNSKYADLAYYELGITCEIIEKNNQAIDAYEKIISDFPNSNKRADAMLKKGSIYRILGQNEKAIDEFKDLIVQYKGTEQSKQGWMNLKAIYTDMDKINSFIELVSEQGSSISNMEKDSMIYQAAENKYMDGDCDNSTKSFTNYINEYPNGSFVQNAYFYRAECQYGQKDFENALIGYDYITSKPFSMFTETSLLKAAKIYFNKKDYTLAIERYRAAIKVLQSETAKQDALKNIQIAEYYNKQYNNAINTAKSYLENPKISTNDKNEAIAIIARSYFQLGDLKNSKDEFAKLKNLKSSELGAEAHYYNALIDYKNTLFADAEKQIFDLINDYASFEFWVAKSFILLSDIYIANNNLYQAKYTLKSVIDNYKGDDLVNEAQQKLDKITVLELEENNNNETQSDTNHENEK